MGYEAIIKKYLKALHADYKSAKNSGQYTAELSFRVPIDGMLNDLAKEFQPGVSIDVILEPTSQGRAGRPDWRIHDKKTLGIYGYVEAKGLTDSKFDITPYKKQIKKYLDLRHKLVITDGIDFVFCTDEENPEYISLIDKSQMGKSDWSKLAINNQFEIHMRDFYNNPAPQQCTEAKLVDLIAIRTRILADEILEYAAIPYEEALNEEEQKIIALLSDIKELVYNHNDPSLRTNDVFADFTAQVIMFCLLYAHRVLCASSDAPEEKERKIKAYILEELSENKPLLPFKNLMKFITDKASDGMFINQWVDECIKFLSFVQMTDQQLLNPDYHNLFEKFLARYDARSRFDYGAYYTPKNLADYIVKLTNYIVAKNFSNASIYDEGNTIIDPCCGTGSFLERIIENDPNDGKYNLCGFEILPAPYMLANYRMSILDKQLGTRKRSTSIIMANTLSNCVLEGGAKESTILGKELQRAHEIITKPIKLIIGNPPCSDVNREYTDEDFSIINELMEDFRLPQSERRSRQNLMKQVNNQFMQFIRWGCKILLDSDNHSVLSFVVPASFLEAETFKYARKYLIENFSDAWILSIDADARTGVRSDSLFYTLQGRAAIILTRKCDDSNSIRQFHYCDISKLTRQEKADELSKGIDAIIRSYTIHDINTNTYSFMPTQAFDEEMYGAFWAISSENGQKAIFKKHCSGIKLAPTAMFTHVKAPILKRRSKTIATGGYDASKEWFEKQDKPPKKDKVDAFQTALNACGNIRDIDEKLEHNIFKYAFRPYMTTNVLLWQDLLRSYARVGGGGTRLRPEIIKAYGYEETIGFAMAHAPKDLNPTLSQFVSFCWYYPDNDMCTRGNSHIYMNQYPGNDDMPEVNIDEQLIKAITELLECDDSEAARDMVFYVYALLCSQVYLDEFEGALFTVNQSDMRARVPIVKNRDVFEDIVHLGMDLAELEKAEYVPENILGFDYDGLKAEVPSGFKLKNSKHPFDEDNEKIILTDGDRKIEIDCPIELQKLNISGYDVIKAVWLKFNSYDFTHCDFTQNDLEGLLNYLNTLAKHTEIVARIDDAVRPILQGEYPLIVSMQ